MTLTTYLPGMTLDGALIDNVVELPSFDLVDNEVNAKLEAGQPVGEIAVKETVPLNLYREKTPIVVFTLDPASIRRVDG